MTALCPPPPREVSVLEFGAIGDGAADDTAALLAALASGAARVRIPPGTFLTRRPLEPHPEQCLVLDGTLRVAPTEIQPLAANVAAGDSDVELADASGFAVGEWVTLHDKRLPIQGGGPKIRRQNAGNARIVAIHGNRLVLDQRSARDYRREADALLARQHAAILIRHDGVRICGSGTVDGNKRHQFDAAPCRLELERGEDWRAACGIAACGNGRRLERILIEGVTVCDATLHNIGLRDADCSVIRQTVCLRAHDKNITLSECRDCLVTDNIAADSEWEDGIIFHQRPDPATACARIRVRGNLCAGNARNGISVGGNLHEIFLSDNLCVNNAINISIHGDHCSSADDVAIGGNGRVFPLTAWRAGVEIAGRSVTLSQLTVLGSPCAALRLSGTDIVLRGGLLADPAPQDGSGEGAGIDFRPGHRASQTPPIEPDRITVSEVTIRGFRNALRLHPSTGQVALRRNRLAGNASPGDIPPEALARCVLEENEGLPSRNRGVARFGRDVERIRIPHGLCRSPGHAGITLTPVGHPGAASRFWLGDVGPREFEIVADRPPESTDALVAWTACADTPEPA